MAESVYAIDLKSMAREGLWVQVPPRVPAGLVASPRVARVLRGAKATGRVAKMSTESQSETTKFHGGRLIARRLKAHGVSKLFTLSGGHLFSIYDGCREEGIELIDVRQSTAAFAAEGWAKVTREPGVCATAGPGVTNGMSAMASAQAQPLADGGARRSGPRAALGAGLAPGDRPRAVRAARDQAGGDPAEHPGDPGVGGRGLCPCHRTPQWPHLPGLPRTTCSWRPRSHGSRARLRRAGRSRPRGPRSKPWPRCWPRPSAR